MIYQITHTDTLWDKPELYIGIEVYKGIEVFDYIVSLVPLSSLPMIYYSC